MNYHPMKFRWLKEQVNFKISEQGVNNVDNNKNSYYLKIGEQSLKKNYYKKINWFLEQFCGTLIIG